MFVLGNILLTVAGIAGSLITIYSFVVFIACILTWVNADPYNPIVRIINTLTEPVFYRIRKYLPFVMIGGIDLSPIVLIVLLQLFDGIVIGSLYDLAITLKV